MPVIVAGLVLFAGYALVYKVFVTVLAQPE
jgi:hypothetical protein